MANYWPPLLQTYQPTVNDKDHGTRKDKFMKFINDGYRFFDEYGTEWQFYAACEQGVFLCRVCGTVSELDEPCIVSGYVTTRKVTVDNTVPRLFRWNDLGAVIFAVPSPVSSQDFPIPAVIKEKSTTKKSKKNVKAKK